MMKRLLTPVAVVLGLLVGMAAVHAQTPTGDIGPTSSGGGTTFVGGVLTTATSINDDLCFTLGSSDAATDPCIRHDTTQTVDTGMLLTGTVSNHWVIAERQDETFDFAHAAQTNPTLFIHSAAQSTTQWVGLSHDGTNANITTGAGHVAVPQLSIAGNGTKTDPSIEFNGSSGAAGLGFYAIGNNQIIVTTTNNPIMNWVNNNNINISSNYSLNWATGAVDVTSVDVGFARSAAGVIKVTTGGSVTTIGLLGGGTAVASAAAMPLPTGRVFHVTGTTSITSITSTNFGSGAVITLIFDDVLTFTDGSNLKLAGNFVTSADDTITLAYDGTNWYEVARSAN